MGSGKTKVCRRGVVTTFTELKIATQYGENLCKNLVAWWEEQATLKGSGLSEVDSHWWGVSFREDSRIRLELDQTRCLSGLGLYF